MQMGKFIPGAWSDPWSLEALFHVLHARKRLCRVCCSRDVPDPPTPKWHDSRSRRARHKARFRGKRLCEARALGLYSYCPLRMQPTPRGFEPLQAEPNGFRVHLLSRSAQRACAVSTLRLQKLKLGSANANEDALFQPL